MPFVFSGLQTCLPRSTRGLNVVRSHTAIIQTDAGLRKITAKLTTDVGFEAVDARYLRITHYPCPPQGPKVNTYAPQPGVARGPSQYVPSSRRSGDQANHSRAIEARDSIGAYVHSTRLADWFAIEQH